MEEQQTFEGFEQVKMQADPSALKMTELKVIGDEFDWQKDEQIRREQDIRERAIAMTLNHHSSQFLPTANLIEYATEIANFVIGPKDEDEA